MNTKSKLTATDKQFLSRCIDLAQEALEAGDQPFGSILIDKEGKVLAEGRNKDKTINRLAHPEYELSEWALNNLTDEQRREATIYTSGEHCPMCSAAHGMAGIGTVVYAASGKQLNSWLKEWGAPLSPIHLIPIQDVIKEITVRGPADGELLERIKVLQKKANQ